MYSIEIYFKNGNVHYFEQCSIFISRGLVSVYSFDEYFPYFLCDISSISFCEA